MSDREREKDQAMLAKPMTTTSTISSAAPAPSMDDAPITTAITSPPGVLRVIVLQVLPALDRPPPGFVVLEPLDRRLDRVLEPVLRPPPKLLLNLGRVDRVAPVVAGAVLHVLD